MYAISYDPVETLERFAAAHRITYPLLSDSGSRFIEEIGLLNATIEAEVVASGRTVAEKHHGLPYPGTFFLDEGGTIIDKRFERFHRIRPTGNTLLARLTGADGIARSSLVATSSPGVQIAAWLDTDVVSANQLQDLHVRIQMDDDVHLYVEPIPEGYRAISLELTGDEALRPRPHVIDGGRPFVVDGLDEEFFVVDGTLEVSIPFTVHSNRDTSGDPDRAVDAELVVSYQACTQSECFAPERRILRLSLTEIANPA